MFAAESELHYSLPLVNLRLISLAFDYSIRLVIPHFLLSICLTNQGSGYPPSHSLPIYSALLFETLPSNNPRRSLSQPYQINRLMGQIETRMNKQLYVLIPEIGRKRLRRDIALEEKRQLYIVRKVTREAVKRVKHDLSAIDEGQSEPTD